MDLPELKDITPEWLQGHIEGIQMNEKGVPECFGNSHGCEWVLVEPRCPCSRACIAKDEALRGKRDCTNCIVLDVEEHMKGFDRAIPEFTILKRFLKEVIKDWCADCTAYGYSKWQKRVSE
jgi:hypothetical protein